MQSKLFNAPVACPVEGGCDTVLNSDYAQLFGIPLSAFGVLSRISSPIIALSDWCMSCQLPHARRRRLFTELRLQAYSSRGLP